MASHDRYPMSICGDSNRDDSTISAEVLIERAGFVSLFGRVTADDRVYELKWPTPVTWELRTRKTKLKGGKVSFSANAWHTLKLTFRGDES